MDRLPTFKITQSGSSESELGGSSEPADVTNINVGKRQKRRVERGLGMNELFTAFKEELAEIFETKFAKLHTELQDLRKQNLEISKTNTEMAKSMEFMSSKYDNMKEKLDRVIKERDDNKIYISTLEQKVESLERNIRSSTIEIKNIPKKQGEEKSDLIKVATSIGSALKIDLQSSEIQDAYRLPNKKGSNPNMPILIRLNTVIRKEEVMKSYKKINKGGKEDLPLSAQNIYG